MPVQPIRRWLSVRAGEARIASWQAAGEPLVTVIYWHSAQGFLRTRDGSGRNHNSQLAYGLFGVITLIFRKYFLAK